MSRRALKSTAGVSSIIYTIRDSLENVTTKIVNFTNFLVFGGFLLFETSLVVKVAVINTLLIHKTKRVIEEMDTKRKILTGRTR